MLASCLSLIPGSAMRNPIRNRTVLFVLMLWFGIYGTTNATVDSSLAVDEISIESLDRFISLGTSYIVRISHTREQDPSNEGKFTYIAYLSEKLPLDFTNPKKKEYNLLRHNGAIYSLSLSYARKPDDSVLDAMKRSVSYLKKFAIGPVPDVSEENGVSDDEKVSKLPTIPNLMAAWENSKITGDNESAKAKLGGAGLALIALVSLEQIEPGESNLGYLRQIGEFIHFLQHADGSFTCRYIPTEGGKDDSWDSLYYPGEAALGVLYLAAIETDETYKEKWISVATKALTYLESIRRVQQLSEIEPDHWALLATQRLLPLLDKNSKEYWLVYDHGVRVVKSMLTAHSKKELKEDYHGCFTGDKRTCPTATRLEGLIAALSFVQDTEMIVTEYEDMAERLVDRMRHDIRLGARFLLESQETDEGNNMHGGVPVRFPALDHRSKEVRVDYVQHSMSAMIAYEKLLLSEEKLRRPSIRLGIPHLKASSLDTNIPTVYIVVIVILAVLGVILFTSKKKKKGHKDV
jgi:hypothetical protein